MMDWQDLSLMLTRPIAYHRIFAAIGGGATAGLFLSQAFYWSGRTTQPGGWFYKTAIEWSQETGLTRCEQETARKKLIAKGLLEEKKEGLPCKLYYRIKQNRVLEAIAAAKTAQTQSPSQFAENQQTSLPTPDSQLAENQQTGLGKSDEQVEVKPANILYTETTTEITSDTTTLFQEREKPNVEDTISPPAGGTLELHKCGGCLEKKALPQQKSSDPQPQLVAENRKNATPRKYPTPSIENYKDIKTALQPWHAGGDYDPGFLSYLVSTYLPTVGKWRDLSDRPTLGDAKNWIYLRERDGNLVQIQNKWDDYQDKALKLTSLPSDSSPATVQTPVETEEEIKAAKAEARAILDSILNRRLQ